MKINQVQPVSHIKSIESVKAKHLEKKDEKGKKPSDETAKYEPSGDEKPVTYTKTGHVYDHKTVEKLKKQTERAYAHLIGLVEKLLLRQGYSIKTITDEEWDDIEIDEATRLEAQDMIAPGGPLSAEAVSDRIVDFAKAVSGGDTKKLDKLKGAIEKGFKQAESMLGGLPEISQETHRLVMEKLDAWAQESTQQEIGD